MASDIGRLIDKFGGYLDWPELCWDVKKYVDELESLFESSLHSPDLGKKLEARFSLLAMRKLESEEDLYWIRSTFPSDSSTTQSDFTEFLNLLEDSSRNLIPADLEAEADKTFYEHYSAELRRIVKEKSEAYVLRAIERHPDIKSCPVCPSDHRGMEGKCPICDHLLHATVEQIAKEAVNLRRKKSRLCYGLNNDIVEASKKRVAEKKKQSKSPEH